LLYEWLTAGAVEQQENSDVFFCILHAHKADCNSRLGSATQRGYNLVGNFGPGNTYLTDTGDAWATGGSGQSGNAVSFSDSFTDPCTLNTIEVADNFSSSNPDATSGNGLNDLVVGSDLNSATELETWTIPPPALASTPELFTLTPASASTPSMIPVILPGTRISSPRRYPRMARTRQSRVGSRTV